MERNTKRKVVLSVLTLCLLLVLLAGSSYALFSDSAKANVAVGSATVDVEAKIASDYKLYSLDVEQTGKFELGGTAELDATTGELKLINIAPGDRIEFKIEVTNLSNIDILQRVRLVDTTADPHTADQCLFEGANGLVVKVNGVELTYDSASKTLSSGWSTVNPTTAPVYVTVSIELPVEAGNEYQNLNCDITIVVDAYQGNADKTANWQG